MGNINVSRGQGELFRGILVVLGAPASGKTTVAERLASITGCSYLNVGSLAKERGYILGKDEERNSLILDEEAVLGELRELCKKMHCLIVETISPTTIPEDLVSIVIAVRCRPSVLLSRLKERGYSPSKIRENIEYEAVDGPLYDALQLAEEGRIVEIDGCEGDLDSEIERILDAVRGKSHRLGRFNWSEDFMSVLDALSHMDFGQ